jgi:hypothetical protein
MLWALAAIWVGWPQAINRIANEGLGRLARVGMSTDMEPQVYPFLQLYALMLLLWGWIFWAMFTTFFINQLLRAFFGGWINF